MAVSQLSYPIITTMKRLALSLLGGVAIPFLYAVIVGPLTNYTENESLRQIVSYPVRWPAITLNELLPLDSFPFRDRDGIFLLVFIVVCDVLLYSIVTYLLLWRFWKRKTKEFELPPKPPSLNLNSDR